MSRPTSRVCSEVQAHLPGALEGRLPRGRRWLVDRHLRRCADCRAEMARQRLVVEELARLGQAVADEDADSPPPQLLDTLLEQARRPGLRGRAAVPARGAVSGARPALSLALLATGAAAGTAAGYAVWRGSRAIRRRVSRRRRR